MCASTASELIHENLYSIIFDGRRLPPQDAMFITFEGPDGCGKTTQIILLDTYLTQQQGYSVLHTREPGGTEISERIREVVHDRAHAEMDNRTEILLYSASRAQLVAEKIRPALTRGDVVLCDRFFDSTYAYQGYGRGLDLPTLRLITEFATGGLKPDLTVYLDVDPEEGLRRRMKDRQAEWNRLDNQALAFHQRAYSGYQELIAEEPDRWVVIDGSQSEEAVQVQIRARVMERLIRHATA